MVSASNAPSRLIAIETAGSMCGAAFFLDGRCLGEENLATSHDHAKKLAPLIQRLALRLEFPLSDIDAVAATIGPGGFTGIRVGLAMARGLALAARCQAIGIDAFQRLAHSARRQGQELSGRNLVVIDSRRAELFAAILDRELRYLEPAYLTTDVVASAREKQAAILISDCPDGAACWAGSIPVHQVSPSAGAVGELAFLDERAYCLPAEPQYLRAPDVTKPAAAG